MSAAPANYRLAFCDVGDFQGEQRLTGDAQVLRRRRGAVADGEDFVLPAASAGGGGRGRVGVGRNRESGLQFADASRFQFERRVAAVADVVEAALRLAGIDDVVRTALGAADCQGCERHRDSTLLVGSRAVKFGRCAGSPEGFDIFLPDGENAALTILRPRA